MSAAKLAMVLMIAIEPIRSSGNKIAVGEEFESDDQLLIDCGAARLKDDSDAKQAELEKAAAEKAEAERLAAEETKADDDVDGDAETGGTDSDGTDADSSDADDSDVDAVELTDEQKAVAIKSTLTAWLSADPEKKESIKWTTKGLPRNNTLDKAVRFNVLKDDVLPIFDDVKKELGITG